MSASEAERGPDRGDRRAADARAVLALLVNPTTRELLARLALGDTLEPASSASKERRALDRLVEAGVATRDPDADGGLRLDLESLKAGLAAHSSPAPTGVDRFVRGGRVDRFPASGPDREQLLAWIARQVLQPGERVEEGPFTARLAPYVDEPVLLRRRLVDHGAIERARDGSWYALPED